MFRSFVLRIFHTRLLKETLPNPFRRIIRSKRFLLWRPFFFLLLVHWGLSVWFCFRLLFSTHSSRERGGGDWEGGVPCVDSRHNRGPWEATTKRLTPKTLALVASRNKVFVLTFRCVGPGSTGGPRLSVVYILSTLCLGFYGRFGNRSIGHSSVGVVGVLDLNRGPSIQGSRRTVDCRYVDPGRCLGLER